MEAKRLMKVTYQDLKKGIRLGRVKIFSHFSLQALA